MELESALKHFSPKGLAISDSSKCTSTNRITGTDIMAALGMAESKATFGMAAFLGKHGVSNEDTIRTVEQLTLYARRQVPKLITKASGRQLGKCLVILAKMAFEEYSRSAATTSTCTHCNGRGLISVQRDVIKYAGYKDVIEQRIETEWVDELCSPCNGKGVISSRCRCNGTGKVVDREATKATGAPVIKICERCTGRGYSRVPSSVAYTAIKALLPDLNERTWRRNWKPFYEKLVAKCDIEENRAASEFSKITQ
ncbi:antitermination protein [Photorhabdus luminescens]|uniref:Antitermination protein n=1 Tax=Photorhabdus luminescens subsp. mexicana TaxID=2100167 RepID=A0A4R4IT86_PHOLU|nr:antitermination protein [Photorhabdus luminescens]TDB44013.1 antitermination protein [Photorhabdus luminescens subsp. mexicana]